MDYEYKYCEGHMCLRGALLLEDEQMWIDGEASRGWEFVTQIIVDDTNRDLVKVIKTFRRKLRPTSTLIE